MGTMNDSKPFQIYPESRVNIGKICRNCGGTVENGVCTTCNWHVSCCVCKKIRDENGIWIVPEKDLSDKNRSHGICPVCKEERYWN